MVWVISVKESLPMIKDKPVLPQVEQGAGSVLENANKKFVWKKKRIRKRRKNGYRRTCWEALEEGG